MNVAQIEDLRGFENHVIFNI